MLVTRTFGYYSVIICGVILSQTYITARYQSMVATRSKRVNTVLVSLELFRSGGEEEEAYYM
jgi:hypothetical protein